MKMAIEELIESIRLELAQVQRILVVAHVRPDGDAVGSLLGLGLALQAAGKQVQMVLSDGVPGAFAHLPGVRQVAYRPQGRVDYIIVVDCSDLERVGPALDAFNTPDLNIDHHITNLNFARTNLVDPQAVSTTQIIANLLPKLDLPLTPESAQALLTGLITDTLGFRTPNITPAALRLAAALMEAGANLPDLYFKAQIQKSFEAVRFWGSGLARLTRENGLVWTALTMGERQAAGYGGRDDADLVNILSAIDGFKVAVIFVEQPNGGVKISWRSQPGFDVSKIALSFGGGGHPNASGAEVEGELTEVQNLVLEATRKLFSQT